MKLCEQFALMFTLVDMPCQFRYESGGIPAIEVRLTEGRVSVMVWYSVSDKPLALLADADPGNQAQLIVRPWRLELWINEELLDEEWPFGEPRFLSAELAECHVELALTEIPDMKQEKEQDVLGRFTGAEGWRPGKGVYVGDCMPYVDGGRFHVLYLKDRHHHGSKWGKGAHQWAHISSDDLIHWDIHPMAVEIDDPTEGSICTGSWICQNGVHQLYYTVRMADGSSAPIRRSLSPDGIHYQKDSTFGFTLSSRYVGSSARDPKVVLAEDGTMHMFVTTKLTEANRGCLAHLVSDDGNCWRELEPIYVAPDDNEPECSDYFHVNGRYYLIFSHYARAQYRISDQPFTDWRMPADPGIPCHSVPKAAIWKERIIFVGFENSSNYAGIMTFIEAEPDEKGELRYFPVKYDNSAEN